MKKKVMYLSMLIIFITVITTAVIGSNTLNAASGGFTVDGTVLRDSNGNSFIMRGVNHAHTWYKTETPTAIPAIAAAGANTVRIVLSNGAQWTYDTASEVDAVLDLCEQYNLIAVLEVHDATGYNDITSLLNCAEYFVDIQSAIKGREDTVIINIANEWNGEWESSNWANGYLQAIPIIRNAGLTHTIMVDGAGWGQYPQSIIDRGQDVLEADPQGNVIFSWHGYEYAAGNSATIQNNIDQIIDQDLCLAIGEFGNKHTSGDVDEAYLMSYCQQRSVGWLAWSWKGNSTEVEYLDLSNNWTGTNLSSWGDTIVNGTNGLKTTSKICSIFSGNNPVTPITTSTPTTSPDPSSTTTPVNNDSVTVDYKIQNDWGSGATIGITLENNSSSAIESWSVSFDFPNDQQITNLWGAIYTQNSSSVTISNSAWNGYIPVNSKVSIGFNINYINGNDIPTSFLVN
ncbi:MAG: cellulase family glycosylhydrolase [Clostridiales bacterium]